MASPAEIVQALPETLPEDFGEWDSGNSAATLSVNSSVSEPATDDGVATKPPAEPASPQFTVLSVLDGSSDTPRFTAASFYEADEALLRAFRSSGVNKEVPKRTSKKRMTVTVVTVGPILLLLALIPWLYPSLLPGLVVVKHSIAQLSTATDKNAAVNTLKPSPSKQLTGVAQPSTTAVDALPSTQSETGAEPATSATEEATPPQVQSKMMTDQLAAPNQIPHDIKVVAQDEAPASSSFGGAGMEGLGSSGGNVIGSVFGSGNKGPKVKGEAPTKLNISSGVAEGMLVKKTMPQYPAIAKSASISGTVVLQATISKAGTIENLRAITGPGILRPSAMDAVKSWRYRPYLLNGEPVEVETTVNVVFTTVGH